MIRVSFIESLASVSKNAKIKKENYNNNEEKEQHSGLSTTLLPSTGLELYTQRMCNKSPWIFDIRIQLLTFIWKINV